MCVYCKVSVQYNSFAYGYPVFHHHWLKRLFFSHCLFLVTLSRIGWLDTHEFISGFSVLSHWSMCLFLCQHSFDHYNSVILFETRECDTFNFVLPQGCLAIWGLLWFHTYFRTICSSSVKNAIYILIEMVLKIYRFPCVGQTFKQYYIF